MASDVDDSGSKGVESIAEHSGVQTVLTAPTWPPMLLAPKPKKPVFKKVALGAWLP